MTIQNEQVKNEYIGNGSIQTFDYDFWLLESDHLRVYFDGVEQNSGYTVNNVGNQNGGTVVFTSAPDDDVVVTLYRDVPVDQLTDYTPYDAFPAQTHELALDKLTMLVQQIKEQSGRSIITPLGRSYWDAKGRRIVNLGEPEEDTDAATKGYLDGVAADAIAQATQQANRAENEADRSEQAASASLNHAQAAGQSANEADNYSDSARNSALQLQEFIDQQGVQLLFPLDLGLITDGIVTASYDLGDLS